MPTRQKTRMIDEMTQRLAPLEEQKERLDDEADALAEKRNKLNEKSRNLRAEIQGLRVARDETNRKVKELKQRRDNATARIRDRIEEIRKLSEKSRGFARKKPSQSHKALKEEVEGIDWKIQTSSLTIQEERVLVDKVKTLEGQLDIHRQLEQSRKKIAEARHDFENLKAERQRCHEALTVHARESQAIHAKMLAEIEESRKTRMEADDLHRQLLAVRKRAGNLQEEIMILSNNIRRLKDEIRNEEERKKKQNENLLRQDLEKKAAEKLKRGEKLSWEEFQLLAEKGITAQD